MIISLADKQRETRQDIVDRLEEALALAREGKIVDFIIAYVEDDKTLRTYCSYEYFLSAVGLAEMLKRDVIDSAED
jgi:hypothetical protein